MLRTIRSLRLGLGTPRDAAYMDLMRGHAVMDDLRSYLTKHQEVRQYEFTPKRRRLIGCMIAALCPYVYGMSAMKRHEENIKSYNELETLAEHGILVVGMPGRCGADFTQVIFVAAAMLAVPGFVCLWFTHMGHDQLGNHIDAVRNVMYAMGQKTSHRHRPERMHVTTSDGDERVMFNCYHLHSLRVDRQPNFIIMWSSYASKSLFLECVVPIMALANNTLGMVVIKPLEGVETGWSGELIQWGATLVRIEPDDFTTRGD